MRSASASGTTRLSCDRVAFSIRVGRPKVESSDRNLWSPSPGTRLNSIQAASSAASLMVSASARVPRTQARSRIQHDVPRLDRPRTFHDQGIGNRIEGAEDEYQAVALGGELNGRGAVARFQIVPLVIDHDVAVDREHVPGL